MTGDQGNLDIFREFNERVENIGNSPNCTLVTFLYLEH